MIGSVNKQEIRAKISGVIRGLLRSGTEVTKGLKLGDIDPRAKKECCYTISDKARAISDSVLEILLRHQKIAVSIMAELIQERFRHKNTPIESNPKKPYRWS